MPEPISCPNCGGIHEPGGCPGPREIPQEEIPKEERRVLSPEEKEKKNQEKIFQRITEAGPDWESREKAILANLDKRVGCTVDLKHTVDKIILKETHEEVTNKLNAYFESIRSRFPREILKKVKKGHALRQKGNELFAKIDKIRIEKRTVDDKDFEQWNKVVGEYTDLSREPDVQFLLEVEDIIKTLIKKNKYIKKTGDNEGRFKNDAVAVFRKKEIKSKDAKTVAIEAFDVIFELDPEKIKKAYDHKVNGFYLSGTPFIFVDSSMKLQKKEVTMTHEKIHNILETVRPFYHLQIRTLLKKRLNCIKLFTEKDLSVLADKAKEILFTKTHASDIVDEHREEIIAAIEGRRQKVGKQYIQSEEDLDTLLVEFLKNLRIRDQSFSTAGVRITEMIDFLNETSKSFPDEQVRAFCRGMEREIEKQFQKVAAAVQRYNALGEKLGKDAVERIHALYSILPPSQYRHIEKYLEYKYGTGVMVDAKRECYIEYYIHSFDFSYLKIKTLAENWERVKNKLTPEDKKRLSDVSPYNPAFIAEDLDDIGQLRDYHLCLDKLGSFLGGNLEVLNEFNEFKDFVAIQFFFSFLERDLAEDFKNIPDLYAQLTSKEKGQFKATLEDYIRDFLEEDLFKRDNRLYAPEELRKMSLWENLTKIRFDKKN